jgi:hypothetical protein
VESVIDAAQWFGVFPGAFRKARPPPAMSASWEDAERICSRRDFRSLTDGVEKALAISSEW